ncbi:MAG: SpoIIE family protein phosphatase [Candidatus Eremiobacteraeota bacterium]|nr:SpoIIE family protein phosphatase [Candidatus Eremiobacteraeota bacterium]
MQLDEETGVRGFTSTGERFFLEPYQDAVAQFPGKIGQLRADVAQLGLASAPAREVDNEEVLNRRWIETVATPLIAAPHASSASTIQREGKGLIDDFRAANTRLGIALDDVAAKADAQLGADVERIAFFALLAGLSFAWIVVVLNRRTERLETEVVEQQRRYEAQKAVADTLTEAFSQKKLPAPHYASLHGVYVPAGRQLTVGGDWYDAFELPDGRLFFSIGDVVGHGLEAAVAMSRTRQAIVTTALHESDPGEVLARANRTVLVQEGGVVTALCGFVDPRTFEVTYASAGHPAPILARAGSDPSVLPHDGLPLGVTSDANFASFRATAGEGALIVLYTDGVLERTRNVLDGERALLDAVREAYAAREGAAQLIHKKIFAGAPPHDDVAILTIQFAVRDPNETSAVIRSISIPALAAEDIVV